MTGEEIYNRLSIRDHSGSEKDQYAQFLRTLYRSLTLSGQRNEFFELLKQADEQGKKIDLKDHSLEEYDITSLVLV
ncbi:hypothetical protein [Chryseobacterium sp.]|uniref:hypothetical protein n=1 Tax=Chryseobacterium sp. TaxID=1871047 RepID=UPI0012AA2A03|nr:hypothetical protein [Chryseobacterium sp.]QFG53650.1 hypothetical protein F7R58_08825 [Chryseobacterium sp.]